MARFIINSNLSARIKDWVKSGATAVQIVNYLNCPNETDRIQSWVNAYGPKSNYSAIKPPINLGIDNQVQADRIAKLEKMLADSGIPLEEAKEEEDG